MKILEVKSLVFPEVKVIRFARFIDNRGYFAESYRKNDFDAHPQLQSLRTFTVAQTNVSYSKRGTIRGLHFQWDPYLSKLVRTVDGEMIDLVLDIRKGSPNFGKIITYDLSTDLDKKYNEWIWVPQGFAHGSVYLKNTIIEYYCDTVWSPKTEASISPFSLDIDWTLVDPQIKGKIDEIIATTDLISEKDRNGYSVSEWKEKPESDKFTSVS